MDAITNGHVDTQIGTRVRFEFDGGRAMLLHLIDTFFELSDLRDKLAAENKTHLDYLRAVVAYLESETGVKVTLGEADEMLDALAEQYLAKKKRHADAIDAMQTSPRFIRESTPSG